MGSETDGNVCVYHEELYKMVKEIHERLVGNDEKRGVFERLRTLETTKKLMIGAIIAGAGSLLTFVFSVIKDLIKP
jgi:hypothetical protein